MKPVIFVFGNNLDSRTVEVRCRTMRNAMRLASIQLQVPMVNVVFIRILDVEPKLYPNAA